MARRHDLNRGVWSVSNANPANNAHTNADPVARDNTLTNTDGHGYRHSYGCTLSDTNPRASGTSRQPLDPDASSDWR